MAEFDNIRSELAAARAVSGGIARQIFGARQQLARLRGERRRKERLAHDREEADTGPLAALDRQIAEQESLIDSLKRRLDSASREERAHTERLHAFTDPRRNVVRLSDRIPVLLMPLRMETRFRRAADIGSANDELWVRVYPDDVSIDSFEESLTQSEAQRARAYWAAIWSGAGDEAQERGAWRVLVSGVASGRARQVIATYRPLNEADRPVKAAGVPTLILTVTTQDPLDAAQKSAAADYWTALWRAHEDAAGIQGAEAALVAAVGGKAAELIRGEYRPRNLADLPPAGASREDAEVKVAFLEVPADEAVPVRESSWSQVPRATTLPDRLVLIGHNDGEVALERLGEPIPASLAVAPDPSAEEDSQIRPEGTDLKVGDELKWVTDFTRAIDSGMGFRVPLSPQAFARGFDSLMVLGVRMSADPEEGRKALETLIAHHHGSRTGFSVLPQGRPTNNVEGENAAFSWQEDPDVSFDHYFRGAAADPSGWYDKPDGRWLAEMLGIDPAAVAAVPFSRRTDVADARAMNVALWPATLGYFLEAMLHPMVESETASQARDFFTRHVSARGPMPAIRVGKQPYGILPATARSRIGWLSQAGDEAPVGGEQASSAPTAFLRQLYELLRRAEADFEPLLARVSRVGQSGGDPHQVLLDVIGLHPSSVEYRQRYAQSFDQLYNRLRMEGGSGAFVAAIITLGYMKSGLDLLARLGHAPGPAGPPDILEKMFLDTPNPLKGGLIDDRPLSESLPIRAYTQSGANYIEWLIEAARTSHDALRSRVGLLEHPKALLYLMLHHALDLSFVETSVQLFANAGLITAAELAASRREPAFLQVRERAREVPAPAEASRWQYLYREDALITGTGRRTVGEFIPTVLSGMQATAYLKRQIEALEHLRRKPTSVLERLLAEHLDLCSYRLDAWYGGLLSHQLETLRYPVGEHEQARARTGIHLGAFGWVEAVRPEPRNLAPVALSPALAAAFDPDGSSPPMRDDTNQGYIHAPSLDQAVTAAVLRNGYLSNATPANASSFAVNLSSERVRTALSILEGMRAEQSLGALLGYRFERGLHDRHDVEVDAFILDLRKAFPLVGDRLATTQTGATDELGEPLSMDRIEARNVIDGLALVEHINRTRNAAYPFGLGAQLPAASSAQAAALSEEARRIVDVADALADLAMAETVHQTVLGNYERAGAVLDTYSKGRFPTVPEVALTPRSGIVLNHRAALHLKPGLDPSDAGLTPRARAEPAINAWLERLLPPAASVACSVTLADPASPGGASHLVTQADLGLLAIDLLYLLDPDDERSGLALDDLIEAHAIAKHATRADAEVSIGYSERLAAVPDHVPFLELAALVRPLRGLLLRSRPLRASDMTLAQESGRSSDADESIALDRITLVRDELSSGLASLAAFHSALDGRLKAEEHAEIATEIDDNVAAFASLMSALSPFAAADTGTGTIFADRRRIFSALRGTLQVYVETWNGRLADFDLAISAFDADPSAPDERKLLALQMAEDLISTTRTDPLPAPNNYRNALAGPARTAFVGRRDALSQIHDNAAMLGALHDAIEAARPLDAPFHPTPIDIEGQKKLIIVLAEDMARRSGTLAAELAGRLAAVEAQLEAHSAADSAAKKVAALTAAAKALLGPEFQIVPDFALPPAQAAEWSAAWGPGPEADKTILGHLTGTLGRRFPVDDWFGGVARVREKMHDLEAAGHLASALSAREFRLEALQFPHRAEVPWLGMEFPKVGPDGKPFIIDEDKLLYTGVFAQPFNPAKRQCGLLLDEWTEIIPSRTEETGLAFHFDRPNCEPPQVLLLALPPAYTGGWRWQDLVDTVRETMDLARKRAIEPDHIDTTAYARFLPAIISSATLHPVTASLNFAFNNNLAAILEEADGERP